MSVKSLATGLAIVLLVIGTGMLGAWAFNPDSGTVAHVEALWRVFGIAAYLGALALPLLLLRAAVAASARAVRACRRRHAL